MMQASLRSFPTVLLALGLWGCAGYRVGPTNGVAAGDQSIQVNPFQNQTLEPRLIEPVLSALRKNLQQDGTFRLKTRGAGDIVVNGILTRYDRVGLSYAPTDVLTLRDFSLRLVAHVTAIEQRTGRTLLDRDVEGRTNMRSGVDQPSAERQAVPLLAEDLARKVTSLLADGTW